MAGKARPKSPWDLMSDPYVKSEYAKAEALPPEQQLKIWKNMTEEQKLQYIADNKPTSVSIQQALGLGDYAQQAIAPPTPAQEVDPNLGKAIGANLQKLKANIRQEK